MRDAFVRALSHLASADRRIVLITGDLGFGVLDEFAKRYPKQFINAGVAEQNMTGLAAGLALEGRCVFTYSIGNFATLRCLEQIRNDVAYHQLNVNVVAVGGGFSYGALGATHHATEDIAIMRSLPNMTVFAPNDDDETFHGVQCLAVRAGPSYIRLDRTGVPGLCADVSVEIGKARLLRHGKDITLIATGGIAREAMQASEELAKTGVECRVLSMHTVKPLDQGAIRDAVHQTRGIVTIEEHSRIGGLGGAIAEALCEENLFPDLYACLALPPEFSALVGSQKYLRSYYGLDAPGIARRVAGLVGAARAAQLTGGDA